jgi:uncharacterized membrane protein YvbJ
MGELVPVYALNLAQSAPAGVATPVEDEQSAKWAKIMAALIFIIALMLMPTFFVEEDQSIDNSSSAIVQTERAG